MTRPGRLIRKLQKPAAQGLRRTGIYESGTFYTHRLSLLNRLLARTTKEMLARQFGLSQMEWRVLIQLEHRSPSKISEMHERSLVPKSQLSAALPHLIRKGLAVRENDPADARAPYFAITEEGLQTYRNVMRLSRKRQRSLELALSRSERDAFEAAIDRLTELLTEEARRTGIDLFGGSPDAAADMVE